ncbi:MAG TPA: AAA family ATPase, partial [Polyangiaceae bacterium]
MRSNGAFLSGKFDQLERNVPYGAFSQALRRMVRQLLFESDERLADLRRSLGAALGTNAQLMVDLIPELSQILGPQPEVPALGPTETKHRFRRVFREFIRVFARPEHPLVIFVDDLQWMDASTPELLTELFTGDDVRHLLVIGSYRDNEVKEGHLLSSCLRSLRERRRDVIRELALHPLSEQDVNALVAETLRSDQAETAPLTRVLYEKTEGNPLYVNELLASLHRAGAFVFLGVQGRWSYDLTRVQNAAVSESVAELMVSRLEKLPESSLAVLTSAACIGMQFELTLLAELSGASVADTAEALWEAIVQRIVVPLDGNYRLMHASAGADQLGDLGVKYQFQHDRVHRAVYSLLPENQRTRLHITLARLLAGRAQADIDIFEIVNHYERGSALIQPSERLQLVELNARAGLKAKQSAAYAIAARQYERCIEHARASDALPPAQRFEIHRQRVECTFLSGEVERAGTLCESLFTLATSNLERGAVYVLKTRIVEHQGKLLEAVATIRAGLRLFGVELPESHADIDRGIGEGIGKMQAHLARVPVEELARLPELVDAERVMTLNLLFQVIPPAIQTYPPLFILAELTMFDLALCHGVTDVSCKNFVDCGIIQGGILGSYDVAYRLGQAAFELLERYRPTPLESSVHFVFGAFVSQFTKPFREGMEAYERATRAGLELGDIQHAAYATTHRSHRSFLVGTNLGQCEREAREGIAFLEGARAAGQLVGMLVVTRSLARLRATDSIQTNGGRTDEEALETLRSANNAQWLFSFGQAQTFVSYVLREWESAARWQAFTEPFAPAGVCLFSQPDYHLFRALLELERVRTASGEERERAWGRIAEDAGKLAIWAAGCAENFAHKSSLLSAENA